MKSYELLDLIGEASEDYVLEADLGGPRPRSRWKAWTAAAAACAACAALVLLVRPAGQSRTADAGPNQNDSPFQDANLTLHAYTIVEGGTANTLESAIVMTTMLVVVEPLSMPANRPSL